MRFQDLIFQRIQRTDTFLCSEANSDWLWLKVGEFRTPVSCPAQGVGSVCQKRGTYGWWQCVNPVLWASPRRSLWQKWGWNWKAMLNCLNHSPNSLFLQLTIKVETGRFPAQIAAAGCNGITGCCSSSDLPCPGAVVLWQGLPELQEWQWQPMLPCKVPWSPFLWLWSLQPIVSHLFHNYSTSLPCSLPQSSL